jgi:hypothetical protein
VAGVLPEEVMRESYLVQRLKHPPKKTGGPLDKAHRVFGGHGIGLSDEAWDIVDEIFEIDYMGSAEYEFGVFPKTLAAMADGRSKLVAYELELKRKEVATNEMRKYKKGKAKEKLPPKPTEPVTVYVVCRKEHRDGADEAIRAMAKGKLRTRDGSHMVSTLDPIEDYEGKIVGWLELNNGFFFTVDKTMWERFCELFEVSADACRSQEARGASHLRGPR